MSQVTTSNAPLLGHAAILDKLYDADAMIGIKRSVARGFLILLGASSDADCDSDVSLGFLALTQGNVLDACFGMDARYATVGKRLLEDAARERDDIRRLAVESYRIAFDVVQETHDQLDRLNCFTRCFFYRPLVRQAGERLRGVFLKLAEAVAETNVEGGSS